MQDRKANEDTAGTYRAGDEVQQVERVDRRTEAPSPPTLAAADAQPLQNPNPVTAIVPVQTQLLRLFRLPDGVG